MKLLTKARYYFSNVLHLTNPYTGTLIQTIQQNTIDQINEHRKVLQQNREKWINLSLQQKSNKMKSFLLHLQSNKHNLTKLITESTGLTIFDSQEQFELTIKMLDSQFNFDFQNVIHKGQNYVELCPYGNILSVFNHPLTLLNSCKYLGLCLKSNNSLILSPYPQSMVVSLQLQKIWNQSVEISMIYTHLSTSELNINHFLKCQDVGFLSFKGRREKGKILYQRLSENSDSFAESQFLLGSCDAAYVDQDASVQQAAKCIGKGIFSKGGDIFCSIKRVFVHKAISKQFIQLLIKQSENYKPGNPLQLQTRLSCLPVIQQFNRSEQTLKRLTQQMQVMVGGKTHIQQQGKFILPTLLKVQDTTIEYQNESYQFPVGFITEVSEPPIELINSSSLGNTFTIFTANEKSAIAIGNQISVGTVNVNTWGIVSHLPYSPRKKSGKGFSFSNEAIENITRTKAISYQKIP